eukprot:CAMPEP_0183558826 /NCGR_PEP_ID=MMETSP0371-20130417/89836_1 /TAXON_ID=268820 /ORGANISM="Peridinium aciculiferum, Strain PAER-2" /LENGTH=72 /DNA_ID=CAMNT_0025766381 /DNA_START=438 /DNA_END=656 /DNA_ORIENTATION=+
MTTADSHPTLNAQATLADAEPSTIDTKMCCGTTFGDNVQHPCRSICDESTQDVESWLNAEHVNPLGKVKQKH